MFTAFDIFNVTERVVQKDLTSCYTVGALSKLHRRYYTKYIKVRFNVLNTVLSFDMI